MLLPELINRHRRADRSVRVLCDEDYAGFRKYETVPLESGGVSADDLVLVDAGMASRDPWDDLNHLPDGTTVVIVVPGTAAAVPLGKIVQSLTQAQLDLVQVTSLEQVYNRHTAVVGVRGQQQHDPVRVRRITWEWALGDLVSRAEHERRVARDAENAARVTELEQQLTEARKNAADLQTRADSLGEQVRRLQGELDQSRRTVRELGNAPARRVGDAIITMRRRPVAGAKDVYAELKASRRRHKNASTKGATSKEVN
ncbi:hypothetical protein GCM10027039_01420 [Terrabacter koreensis]